MSFIALLPPTTANGLTSIPTIDFTAANEFVSQDTFQRPASTWLPTMRNANSFPVT
jgi:hypothetical protein